MKLVYTVELKDWDNLDSYPKLYTGSSLMQALVVFKHAHQNNQDVVLFIDDEEENNLETLENYLETDNIIKCNYLFPQEDEILKREHKEAVQQKDIYDNMYHEQLKENTTLKKSNDYLQLENWQLRQKINNIEEDTKQSENKIYWYAYKLRGMSLGCQPKGFIDHNDSIGRHGIVAYDRALTDSELYDYDLIPYEKAI